MIKLIKQIKSGYSLNKNNMLQMGSTSRNLEHMMHNMLLQDKFVAMEMNRQ